MGLVAGKGFQYRGVPSDLVLQLMHKYNIDSFIETGTYMGQTAIWASSHFKRVVTFEAAEVIYNTFIEKNQTIPINLHAYLGDSATLIREQIKGNSIYYLDAHYSVSTSFNSYPLLEEIRQINKTSFDDFIIIDDVRFVLSKWNGERYCTLSEILKELDYKDRYTVVIDDMMISIPSYAQEILDEYTNQRSTIYWDRYQASVKSNVVFVKIKNMLPKPLLRLIKKIIPT